MIDRIEALRELLREGSLSTQDELRQKLEQRKFSVTQSTISRDLRRLGAMRTTDSAGRIVYILPDESLAPIGKPEVVARSMVRSMELAGSMLVVHTSPGSASLVARNLDVLKPPGVLGTIAGDDTVFIALTTKKLEEDTRKAVEDILMGIS